MIGNYLSLLDGHALVIKWQNGIQWQQNCHWLICGSFGIDGYVSWRQNNFVCHCH